MESKIYYKYPDSRRIVTFRTTRILEIKIVLRAINLTKQSKKKTELESSSESNVCQQSKRFLCTSRSRERGRRVKRNR